MRAWASVALALAVGAAGCQGRQPVQGTTGGGGGGGGASPSVTPSPLRGPAWAPDVRTNREGGVPDSDVAPRNDPNRLKR